MAVVRMRAPRSASAAELGLVRSKLDLEPVYNKLVLAALSEKFVACMRVSVFQLPLKPNPILMSGDDEMVHRRRRYARMMIMQAPFDSSCAHVQRRASNDHANPACVKQKRGKFLIYWEPILAHGTAISTGMYVLWSLLPESPKWTLSRPAA